MVFVAVGMGKLVVFPAQINVSEVAPGAGNGFGSENCYQYAAKASESAFILQGTSVFDCTGCIVVTLWQQSQHIF
jgi:hypothetical protein